MNVMAAVPMIEAVTAASTMEAVRIHGLCFLALASFDVCLGLAYVTICLQAKLKLEWVKEILK